ncbi:2',3'-cyclic-nucleotide 2'-phosphodiesterase/3'-nucleotidase [Rhodovulum imhoffii]|uniref:2',3'-cyclic-nucleotide 2'-phosphodiesterase/3'-nucleotidase n=1 Tax=Rhodovulum imhoffii TaxID=365340 RepID=A0A2T5BSR8_9RHOB|nr:bifunctional 2',3'-cyclic-nucleotide 2'-phosphodiesterase/3'-nucleotidase [Rhodovulum imhoffii]MBK5933430.1 2',3'-cyclic-nucleotide 2'-phosphodiesterase [Rhodovulum imhoffii]PTN02333.1 2',3'-cyclic-nucleotide 2'-phosphodiesterase/3'-nucleotidase [Rhodovulum imhoffii]
MTLHPFSVQARPCQAHLRLLETTDLHVHVFPYDYYADRPTDTIGLARTARHADHLRKGASNSVLLDNGDFLQGTPMGDYIAHEKGLRAGDAHPILAAMAAAGVEVATVGNHEFNYGLDFLLTALAGADFPVVCANIATRQGATAVQDTTLLPPFVILERPLTDGTGRQRPFRLGVIGFTPPQILTWDRRNLEGRIVVRDIVDTARAFVPQMRKQGADLIVALAHSGIGGSGAWGRQENACIPLAAVDEIDVVFAGHQHLLFPGSSFSGLPDVDAQAGTIHGKPAVMAGCWGSHLGAIDLLLEHGSDGWRIARHETTLHPIARRHNGKATPLVDSAPHVLAAAAAAHDATLAYIRRPVGHTRVALHSYFSLVADTPSVQIVADAQLWHMRQMLADTEHAGLPLLSAAAPYKAGGRGGPEHFTEVAPGGIAMKDIANLYYYPNTVCAVRITGAQLRGWLERSAGLFNQIPPGARDAPLLNPDFSCYNFDTIKGVSYEIDVSRSSRFDPLGAMADPQARRIRNLRHAGRPVTGDMEFIVATNSYRAGGGGHFPGADGSTIVFSAPDTNRDVLLRYIRAQGVVGSAADGNWCLAPLPDTTATFETSPRAARLTGDVPLPLTPVATTGGFTRFRIRLEGCESAP